MQIKEMPKVTICHRTDPEPSTTSLLDLIALTLIAQPGRPTFQQQLAFQLDATQLERLGLLILTLPLLLGKHEAAIQKQNSHR